MRAVVSVCAAMAAIATTAAAPAVGTPEVPVRTAVHDLVRAGFPAAVALVGTGPDRQRVAAGVADLRSGEPATPAHRFRIASNTKAFTATVVLQLVAEGRLELDAPVERWLPGVLAGRPTSVRQLLNHTSGLADPTEDREFWDDLLADPAAVHDPAELVAAAVERPLEEPPEYSNTNYLVAGLLIEKVTGRSAVSQVYRRIIVPLHLVHTSFPLTDPRIHGRHLRGYDLAREDVTGISPSYDWTAGAMVSTVDDLARFHRALFSGALLPRHLLTELKRTVPVNEHTALGLGVERLTIPCPDGTTRHLWGNTGGGPGYNSYSLVSEDTTRQLVLGLNTFDIRADVAGTAPVPRADLLPLLAAEFCR
jgi:D-alanyl-D-alanine carboxypeptidase